MHTTLHRLALGLTLAIFLILTGCDESMPTSGLDESKSPSSDAHSVTDGGNRSVHDTYIVVLKDDFAPGGHASNKARAAEVARGLGVSPTHTYGTALFGFAASIPEGRLNGLRRNPRVDYVEPDGVVTLAPPCGTPPCGGGGGNDGGGGGGQTTPWGITRVGGPVSSSGTAWVIDTGIDLDHPDLTVDTQHSKTFVSRGKDSKSADDGNGHGTHVAGTIAAINNDIDVVGVAAGATVVAVKVLDHRGSGTYSDVIDGIDYVAANAAPGDVANMSLGGSPSKAVDDAVRNAADQGVYFAIAAGNDSDDANNYSPARVEDKNVWTVSAFDDTDTFASFSNYSGPTDPPIEFGAPGVDILSLYKDGGTRTLNGTSMASPHMAGVLLVTGGAPSSDGTVSDDPDGDPDPVVHQ